METGLPPRMPSLEMIVDRTSFDETDDFGVDQDALQSSSWSKEMSNQEFVPRAMVMRNGKVRRKMKWRPKSMLKRRKDGQMIPNILPKSSSSGSMSVVSTSNSSQVSRQSKRSVHSFASTQTEKKTNTRKGKSKNRLPLPRPNYPSTFDSQSNSAGVTTIGNEGSRVMAKMSPVKSRSVPHSKPIPMAPVDEAIKTASSWRSRLPPLPGRGSKPQAEPKSPATPSTSMDSSFQSNSTVSSIEEEEEEEERLPTLAGDDLVRRVDLRIRTPQEHRESLESRRESKEDLERPMLLNELRSSSNLSQQISNQNGLSTAQSSDSGSNYTRSRQDQGAGNPDSSFLSRPESPPSHMDNNREMRFRMTHRTTIDGDGEDGLAPTPEKTMTTTCPVNVDDGSFLEAEKNLMAIHEMASEHLRHGEYAEALEVFEEILRGQLARYGPEHPRVGTALHNIGIVHMKRGDFSNAIRVCKEAVLIRKNSLETNHPDVAESLAQLGVAYLETRKHKKSIVAFREALKIRRNCVGPTHPKVSKILNNIGCALYEMNELEVAKVAFEEALDVQRETLKSFEEATEEDWSKHLLSIASTLSNIGSIKLYWGHFDDATIDLEESLLIQQSVLGDANPISQRTQESLEFIDAARDQGKRKSSSTRTHNILSSLTSGIVGHEQSEGEEVLLCNSTSPRSMADKDSKKKSGMFATLEQRLNEFQASLNIDCGGGDDSNSVMAEAPFSRTATF